jgi:hypothetical protein
MLAVLEQGVFDRLRTIDEKAVLFLRDPLAFPVSPYEDEVGQKTVRGRFDELHFFVPSERQFTRPISFEPHKNSREVRHRSHKCHIKAGHAPGWAKTLTCEKHRREMRGRVSG